MKKKKRPFNWYSMFDGPRNLEQLSEETKDMWILYQFIYKEASKDVHGSGTLKNIVTKEQESILPGIRNPNQIEFQGTISISLLLRLYKTSILKVQPNDRVIYDEWYLLKIKKKFRKFAKETRFTVKYE